MPKEVIHNKMTYKKNNSNNTGDNGSKTPEDEEALKALDAYVEENSKYLRAKDFEGEGQSVEVLKFDPNAKGKYGPCVEFLFKVLSSSAEKLWNTTSVGVISGITALLKERKRKMKIRKGSDGKYSVDEIKN
jgi:hypothetical protein